MHEGHAGILKGALPMKRKMIPLVTAIVLCLSTLAAPTANAEIDAASLRRECTHPTVGFPTCYTQQIDGMWAREELADTDTTWVVVGTVTFDEMISAVGDVNAIAP
jgi:hypothetical protein